MVDLSRLKDLSSAKKFSPGTIIIKEGDIENLNMYIVLSGKVGVYKNYRKNGEVLLATLGPGVFFGEMSLFLLQPRNATVVALGYTIAMEVTLETLPALIEMFPDLSIDLMKILCERADSNSGSK